jgi:hypothetical protein
MKRRRRIDDPPRKQDVEQRVVTGKYLLLYLYLQNRYADSVVLTFGQIESLLGFSLPEQARLTQQWWTNAAVTPGGTDYADSWVVARRVATPNLRAQTVAFERAS